MNAPKATYLEELARIRERVHSLFEQAFLAVDFDEQGGALPGSWSPPVDFLETAEAYLLYVELPGVEREDVELQVKERRLELSGRRRSLGHVFLRLERSYGPFRRSFDLEASVDDERIEAKLENGVLRVVLPKRVPGPPLPPTPPARKMPVRPVSSHRPARPRREDA